MKRFDLWWWWVATRPASNNYTHRTMSVVVTVAQRELALGTRLPGWKPMKTSANEDDPLYTAAERIHDAQPSRSSALAAAAASATRAVRMRSWVPTLRPIRNLLAPPVDHAHAADGTEVGA